MTIITISTNLSTKTMTFQLKIFAILAVFSPLCAGIWLDENYLRGDKNFAANSWEKIFESSSRSTTLPLYRHENKLYYMGTHFRVKWLAALQFCEAIHMKLLSIHSVEENERIHKYIRNVAKGNEYWIGGTRAVDGSKFVWMPYGQEIRYSKWSNGQPDNPNSELCLQLWITNNELTWNDRDCNAEFHFICEKYMDSSTSGPPGI